MDIMILQADSLDGAQSKIEAGCNKIASILGPPSLDPRSRGFVPGAQAAFAVVIDGETLGFALRPELKTMFLNLATQCETVVCCRVSPAQKALVVKLVRDVSDGPFDMLTVALLGQGRPRSDDPVHRRWCKRRGDDPGSQYRVWSFRS